MEASLKDLTTIDIALVVDCLLKLGIYNFPQKESRVGMTMSSLTERKKGRRKNAR